MRIRKPITFLSPLECLRAISCGIRTSKSEEKIGGNCAIIARYFCFLFSAFGLQFALDEPPAKNFVYHACHDRFTCGDHKFRPRASSEPETMNFPCPRCSEKLEADESQAGNQIVCPTCSHPFVIPKATARATGKPGARDKQSGSNGKTIALVVLGCIVVLIIGGLAFSSPNQEKQKFVPINAATERSNEATPPASAKLGPEELLRKTASNLDSGKSGDEEWTQVTYDTWEGKGGLNARQGAIRGVKRGFADEKEGIRLEYTVYLQFEDGAWTVKEITGSGIKTAQLLASLAILNTPRIVTPRGSEVTIADVQSQIDQMKAQESAQKSWGQNFFAISEVDRNIISAHLAKSPTEVINNDGSRVPKYVIVWDDLYDIIHSDALTELQKKERWAEFEGRTVHWSGTVCSVGEDTLGHISMDVETNLSDWLGSPPRSNAPDSTEKATDYRLRRGGNVEVPAQIGSSPNVQVVLRDSEKTNALRLHKGNKVEFAGEIQSFPNSATREISIFNGAIEK